MIAMLLWGCMPMVTPDKVGSPGLADTAVTDTGMPAPTQTHALISTLADDYSVGAVAMVDLSTLALMDTLTPTSGDAVVRSVNSEAVVLNRLNTDTIQVFDPQDWSAPRIDFALPDLSNPQDAAWCGDKIWVSLHSADHLPAYDQLGRRIMKADLSDWSGTDGSAEATGMVVHEGALYVALEQFEQDGGWASEGGVVVRIDCDNGAVTEVLEAAPSPAIRPGPEPGTVLVRSGLYGELDGTLQLLDLETLQTEVWLSEAEVGADITASAVHDQTLLTVSADTDWTYTLHCWNLSSGEQTVGLRTASYLSDLRVDDRGRAWVLARAGWSGETQTAPGLHLFDPVDCTSLLPEGETIRPILNPYNVSFL